MRTVRWSEAQRSVAMEDFKFCEFWNVEDNGHVLLGGSGKVLKSLVIFLNMRHI